MTQIVQQSQRGLAIGASFIIVSKVTGLLKYELEDLKYIEIMVLVL